MNYITTTQLRTKSSELVNSLLKGGTIPLIHRSKIIGEIRPRKEGKPLTKEDVYQLKKMAKAIKLPKISYKERARRYGKHLKEKYGTSLS